MESFEAYYDEIEICEAASRSHPKNAIQIRNQQMVDRSDLVVFYVDHSSGGAYQTLRYAQRKNKDHLNLLHTLGEPRENSSDAFVWRSTAPERIIY